MGNNYINVFVTAASPAEAKKISRFALKKRLVACASLIKGVDSSYWWRGKIVRSREVLIVMKTTNRLTARLVREIKKVHSYSVPEIIAVPITAGNSDYLKWIGESVR